jgi:hypothetical protein
MVRYSAYTRPYALPMFLTIVLACAVQGWLDTRRRRWLVVAVVAAFALPLTRVPEPTVFLCVTALTLAWFSHRGRLAWKQTRPLIGITLVALLSLGLNQYFSLASSANAFFDPSPSGVIDRSGEGVHELATAFVPLMGDSFPWWPITVLVLVATCAVTAARRRLFGWPQWWPLLAAPVAFALAYHFVNPVSFDALPYRAREASFFVPAFVLVVAALASVVERADLDRRVRAGAAVVVAAAFVGQLPATVKVVRDDAAPDFGLISHVLTTDLPDDAIVLYDRPTPAGASRQPFIGTRRYMGATPHVATVVYIPTHLADLPDTGPVYLLFNGQCANSGRCVPGLSHAVDVKIPGWKIIYEHDRFTLYGPAEGQSGRAGAVEALERSGEALGPELGYLQTYAAAAVLKADGHPDQARALIDRLLDKVSPDLADLIHREDDQYDIDPFTSQND